MVKNNNKNKLVKATSPYLLQHATNPVDWYEWEEGIKKAKETNTPIFLSIGYAACHWCHVMAQESFEDSETAELMNKYFINIKIDKEERPDIDSHYQFAVALLTGGRGGWPLSVFCTPNTKAFAGGTYFPKVPTYGLPSFKQVIEYIYSQYQKNYEKIEEMTIRVIEALKERNEINSREKITVTQEILDRYLGHLIENFDSLFGGFGLSGPKFPQVSDLRFLLISSFRRNKNQELLSIVTKTFDNMIKGGIYDHLGSGFHRYSVDRKWIVPHFEKMLYDNAQLLLLSLELFQATGKNKYADIAIEVIKYLIREMQSPNGCFYSSQDADSEGVEGKFFLWTLKEIKEILGEEDSNKFTNYYNVSEDGNFENGQSILNESIIAESMIENKEITREKLNQLKNILFRHREKRIKPFLNDNIIVSWNALTIQALTRASFIFDNSEYLSIAKTALDFILTNLKENHSGKLYRNYRGSSKVLAFSEDYSLLISSLLEFFSVTGDKKYLDEALKLQQDFDSNFWDPKSSGYFLSGEWYRELDVREKPVVVFSLPSANAVSLENLLRLYHYTGNDNFLERADKQAQFLYGWEKSNGFISGDSLIALDLYINKPVEIISIIGVNKKDYDSTEEFLKNNFIPQSILLQVFKTNIEKLKTLPFIEQRLSSYILSNWRESTVFICKNFTCSMPLKNGTEIRYYLDER